MLKPTLFFCLVMLLAGCAPQSDVSVPPTLAPFPTVTLGYTLRGALPPFNAIPLDGGAVSAEALVAGASAPTATANLRACPAPDDAATLTAPAPTTTRAMEIAVESFMTAGGTAVMLDRELRENWNALGGTGVVRGDIDLSGEGTPEVVVSFTTPDAGGTLLVLTCIDGRYVSTYRESLGGDAPTLIRVEDMNADGRTDVLYASRNCLSGECRQFTQLAGWSAERARVVNLLSEVLESTDPVRVQDVDQDRINEITVEFRDGGDAQTGPLDTGFTVYDWDGFTYSAALTQLDPPRYLIQIIFQGDQAFERGSFAEAAALYTAALTSTTLQAWQPDDLTALPPYALYRLLLAYSALEDPRRADIQNVILTNYPDPATQPTYASLALTFWNAYQITNNIRSACIEVQSIISARPEALALINRYGENGRRYDAQSICPL
jgi:hypothetical protein